MRPPNTTLPREFRLEKQMASPVVDWLRRAGLAVKREFSLPWGICDFVGVKMNRARVRLRLQYGQKYPVGPALRLRILSEIPDHRSGRSITLGMLRERCLESFSDDFIMGELDRLIRLKFVTTSRNGRFQKVNGWAPLHVRIVAVELKLSRISEALAQASSNCAFATESYVALPIESGVRIANSRRAEEFVRMGIGLLGVSRESCSRLLPCHGRLADPDEILQAHCVERFWRTRDS
jgi:hypothetical protein